MTGACTVLACFGNAFLIRVMTSACSLALFALLACPLLTCWSFACVRACLQVGSVDPYVETQENYVAFWMRVCAAVDRGLEEGRDDSTAERTVIKTELEAISAWAQAGCQGSDAIVGISAEVGDAAADDEEANAAGAAAPTAAKAAPGVALSDIAAQWSMAQTGCTDLDAFKATHRRPIGRTIG